LNGELDLSRAAISRLESEASVRLDWVRDLEAQIADGRAEIDRLAQENAHLENTIVERTKWARSLDAELQALEQAKLVRLGRKLNLIPGKPA
jgi:hypothetical protein